jgi:hypothetical protein
MGLWQPTTGRFGIGRLASMSDPAGATTYSYERRGLLRTEPPPEGAIPITPAADKGE